MAVLPAIDVIGKPYPKGSMVPMVRNGRAFLRPASDFELTRWTGKVRDAAIDFWQGPAYRELVAVRLQFRLPVPSREYHDKDLDKLVRAVLDALTEARVYVDDKWVGLIIAEKVQVGAANPVYGCRMQVATWEERHALYPD